MISQSTLPGKMGRLDAPVAAVPAQRDRHFGGIATQHPRDGIAVAHYLAIWERYERSANPIEL